MIDTMNTGYSFYEDFSVVDDVGQPYGIEVDKTSHYSHGHGKVIDGRYVILLCGNVHRLAMPPVGDFKISFDLSLRSDLKRPNPLGFKVYYRYDRFAKTGNCVDFLFDEVAGKVTISADGHVLATREGVHRADLADSMSLEVAGSRCRISTLGMQAEFEIKQVNAKGVVAFDTIDGSFRFTLGNMSLVTVEQPAKSRIASWAFSLPADNGFQLPLEYEVNAYRYDCGGTEFECTLSGGVASVSNGIESGGSEWCFIIERLTSPYLRFEFADDFSTNSPSLISQPSTLNNDRNRKLRLWNGRREFQDQRVPKYAAKLPFEWPLKRSFFISDFRDGLLIAAGYESAVANPWRFAAKGPYEQIQTWNGEVVHTGDALAPHGLAVTVRSPADKKIVSKIPLDIPRREAALMHAREQHYFFEDEPVRFTIETLYRKEEWSPSEIRIAAAIHDVFGHKISDAQISQPTTLNPSPSNLNSQPSTLNIISSSVQIDSPLKTGVYHLGCSVSAGAGKPVVRDEIFEVLSDNPNALPPPIASGLPEFVSMPNEIKWLEQSAMDPWAEFGGIGHYYTWDNRYPKVGEALQIWRLLPFYHRKWWCWNWSRNSGNFDAYSEYSKDLIRKADAFGCSDTKRQKDMRYELGNLFYGSYYDEELRLLRQYVAERKPPLKLLTLARLDELVEKNRKINAAEFEDLFYTCWKDFKHWMRDHIDENCKVFNDYILGVNPKVARATYGPFAVYYSTYKSAYALTYGGHPVEKDPRVRENGSFWIFEEYHHSCDYPLLRGVLFVATYDFHYGYGRRIFPEIYYSGWTRCLDGAVFNAHPIVGGSLAFTHQRKIAYQYAYGTPQFKEGKYHFWTDYGFHARNPEREAMDEFVYAWGNIHANQPVNAVKAPIAMFDFDAFERRGEFLDQDASTLWGVEQVPFPDVCNFAEEDMCYLYEQTAVNGYTSPVISDFKSLDSLDTSNAEFVILPPIVKGTPKAVIDSIRALHARGVGIIGCEYAEGLEDIFGVRELSDGQPIGYVDGEDFYHREALVRYESNGAEILLSGAARRGEPNDLAVVLVNKTTTGFTAFINVPPALIRRDSFRHDAHVGKESLSRPLKEAVARALSFVAAKPTVKSEYGLVSAAETKDGSLVVVLSDESLMYNDRNAYPVPFRFVIRHQGIENAKIESDAPYSVVSRDFGELILRSEMPKDTALFFKFTGLN